MELELKRLEDLSEAIVQDFTLMRKREEEMRDTNGDFFLLLLYLRLETQCTYLPFVRHYLKLDLKESFFFNVANFIMLK